MRDVRLQPDALMDPPPNALRTLRTFPFNVFLNTVEVVYCDE
ncbi:MAG: hypothetical protein QM759_17025 [Terricaulis sp.]